MEFKIIFVAIRQRWPLLLLFTAAGIAISLLLLSSGAARFESTALIEARPASNITSPALQTQPDRYVQGEIAVIDGSGIRSRVADIIDGAIPNDVSIEQIESSDIIEISVISGNAERSQATAQAFADVYLDDAREQVDSAFAPEIERLESELVEIEAGLIEVNEAISAAAQPFLRAAAVAETPQPIPDISVIDPASVVRQQLLLNDLQQAQTQLAAVSAEAGTAFRTALIEPANLPTNSLGDSVNIFRAGIIVIFTLLGLAAAILATRFARNFLDVESIEEVVGREADSRLANSSSLSERSSVNLEDPRPPVIQEEIDRLAVLVELRRAQSESDEPTLVLIGGSIVGAGATTLAMQLSGTLARRGSATMLVDGDLEFSDLTKRLGPTVGWVAAGSDLEDFDTAIDGLHAVGIGPNEQAPTVVSIVDSVYDQKHPVDIIVVDLGNLRSSAVAASLAPVADWLVLCVPEKNQPQRDLEQITQTYGSTDNLLLTITGVNAKKARRRDAGASDPAPYSSDVLSKSESKSKSKSTAKAGPTAKAWAALGADEDADEELDADLDTDLDADGESDILADVDESETTSNSTKSNSARSRNSKNSTKANGKKNAA